MAISSIDISVNKKDIIKAEDIQTIIDTVNSMIDAGIGVTTQVVTELPPIEKASEGKLYLVLLEDEAGETNKYQEFIKVKIASGTYIWESLGTTSIINIKDASIYVDQLVQGASAGKDLRFQTSNFEKCTLTDCIMNLGGSIDVDTIKISDSFNLNGTNTAGDVLSGIYDKGTSSDHNIKEFVTNDGTLNIFYSDSVYQNASDYTFNDDNTVGLQVTSSRINVKGNIVAENDIYANLIDTTNCNVKGIFDMKKTGTIVGCKNMQESTISNSSVTGSSIYNSRISNSSIVGSSAELTSLIISDTLNVSNNSTCLSIDGNAVKVTSSTYAPITLQVNSNSAEIASIKINKTKNLKGQELGAITTNSSTLYISASSGEIYSDTLLIQGDSLKIKGDTFNITNGISGVLTEDGYTRMTNSSSAAQILWNNDKSYNAYGYDDAKSGIMVNSNITMKANNNIIANSNVYANKNLTVAGTLTANISGDMLSTIVESILSNSDFKKKLLPVGTIIDFYPQLTFGFSAIPDGYVPCGRFYKSSSAAARTVEMNKWKARYSNITIIQDGTTGTMAGLRITSCNGLTIPDFTDRFTVQAGWSYDLGATGGLDKVTLTDDECALPEHCHSTQIIHGKNALAGEGKYTVDAHNASGTIYSSSTCQPEAVNAHENRPPYLAVYKLMKVE